MAAQRKRQLSITPKFNTHFVRRREKLPKLYTPEKRNRGQGRETSALLTVERDCLYYLHASVMAAVWTFGSTFSSLHPPHPNIRTLGAGWYTWGKLHIVGRFAGKLTAAAGPQTEAVQNPTSQYGPNNNNNNNNNDDDDDGINNDMY